MATYEVKNNDVLLEEIRKICTGQTIHHGYILEGSSLTNKYAVAVHFVRSILCRHYREKGNCDCAICRKVEKGNHVDVTVLEGKSKDGSKTETIKIEDIRFLQERLRQKPLEGERNIAIIKEADHMTEQAYNGLLKTLEEPPVGTVILLLSENIYSMPSTVVSRCIHMRAEPWEDRISASFYGGAAEELVDMVMRGEPYYRLKKRVESLGKKSNGEIFSFLDAMEEVYSRKLSEVKASFTAWDKIHQGVCGIEEARKEINSNVNSTYALKKMVLTVGG